MDATLAVACARLVCLLRRTPRCALFLVGRSMKLGIMAGMPRRTVMRLAVARTRLVLLVTMHLALFSLPWLAGP